MNDNMNDTMANTMNNNMNDTENKGEDARCVERPVEIRTMKETIVGKRVPKKRKEVPLEEKIMTEELRKRESSRATKLAGIVKFFFSNLGLLYACIAYAFWGANMYRAMELPAEEERYAEKRRVAREMDDNMEFLADVGILDTMHMSSFLGCLSFLVGLSSFWSHLQF